MKSYLGAMEVARQGIKAGDWVHFFPENTRCEPGLRGTQKFNLGPFQLAIQENVPIVPLVFIDTDRSWPKGKAGIAFREPIVVKSLPEINPKDFATAVDLMRETKRQIDAVLDQYYHDS